MTVKKKSKEKFMARADGMMALAKKLKDSGSDQEREEFLSAMADGALKAGQELLPKALKEGVFTEDEWADWQKNYGIGLDEIGDVLAAHFARENGEFDGEDDDDRTIIILTTEDSGKYRAKDAIKDKFDIKVVGPIEGLKLMEAEMAKDEEERRKKAKEEATYIG